MVSFLSKKETKNNNIKNYASVNYLLLVLNKLFTASSSVNYVLLIYCFHQACRQLFLFLSPPPRFISCPPLYFFLKVSIALNNSRFRRPPIEVWVVAIGRKSSCFWPEKPFKFLFSARKSRRILVKTFFFLFFLGDHLFLAEKTV